MYSMTGYGKGEYREGGIELSVEVKSVNNRFLDFALKAPRSLLSEEDAIRRAVQASISRGHVDVFVTLADKREKEISVSVDLPLARVYAEAARKLKEEFPDLAEDVGISFLLRQPEVLRQDEVALGDEEIKLALKAALETALTAHRAMRQAEGERLKRDLLSRMETISALRGRIAARAPFVAEEYRKKLTDRIREYLDGKVDETRILTEAAVFADKCNIDEELTRLSSHIEEFYKIANTEIVGRKLDFLVQEFNRECNTICSKSNDGEVTAAALEMKNEIEKVREQIQNLE